MDSLEIRPAGERIDAPGFYEMAAAAYHRDPCPEPSLSASLAQPLLHRSPRHAWWQHPRLNPQFEEKNKKRFDFGTAVHSLLFGCGRDLAVIDADSYRTKAAQAERDAAYEAGSTPILAEDYERAKAVMKAARVILDRELGPVAYQAHPETVLAWREGEAWCRAMVDLCVPDLTCVMDLKTTELSARPVDAERLLFNMGYHFKAAFYERGLNALDPGRAGRRRFLFLFQECEPPYEGSMIGLDEATMTIARRQVAAAIHLWQGCIKSGKWPGYPPGVHLAVMPGWAEQAWLNREMADASLADAFGDADGPTHDPTEQPWEGWTP